MSGFEYAFVSEVPRDYFCPICECPMREPVQTKCGHRFCKHCLEQSMKRKRKCPIDRRSLDERSPKDIYPDVAIERTILDFVIKCPNEHNGCKWTGELRNIETHEPDCSFVGVKCTNKDCDATPLRKDLHNHVNDECQKRKVECFHCKTSFIWCMRQGHFDVCKKYPMTCLQKCGEHKIPRDKMNDHIEDSCPHTKVECTFAHVGCKTKVQRKAISDHVKRNTESHLKLACERLQELQVSSALTAASFEDLQTEMVNAMKKIKKLSEAVLKSEGLQDLHEKISETNDKLTDRLTAVRDEVVAIKREVKDLSRNVSNNGELLELEEKINKLQKLVPRVDNLQGLSGEVAGTNKKLRKLQEAIASLEKQNSLQGIRSEVAEANQKIQELQEAIRSLENQTVTIYADRRVLAQIEWVKWEYQRELRDVRENVDRDRRQGQEPLRFIAWIGLVIILIVSTFCTLTFVRKEELQDLQQKVWASSAKLEQLHTYFVDKTHFLQHETPCKAEKFVWLFSEFNSRLWQAQTRANLCFYSEPFFTEPTGYKMCIAICPIGNPAQDTHLSVFVHLLRSNDDDLLPWPFQQKVVFILVDQQDDPTQRKNVKAAISPKMQNLKQSTAFAKPKKSSYMNNKGFGYNNFISHSDLKKRLYIKDDAILFQLEVYPLHCDK